VFLWRFNVTLAVQAILFSLSCVRLGLSGIYRMLPQLWPV
jgi:hypothetical protein